MSETCEPASATPALVAPQIRPEPADQPKPPLRLQKVLKLEILKPAGDMTWKQLDRLLKDARYRAFRLANLAVSEAYLNFHLFRSGKTSEFKTASVNSLNRSLREMLHNDDQVTEEQLNRFSRTGAVPDTVCGALSQYKIAAITAPSKWRDVVRGKSALPTFRLNMAIPVRCDKTEHRRLEGKLDADIAVDLMICVRPYPRVILKSGAIGGGARAVLERLLANPEQLLTGYRQRCFEIKQDDRSGRWHLFITYDFPAPQHPPLDPSVIVGVDLGVSCPAYVAVNNGHARLGRKQFGPLMARIRSLQRQTMSRRRSMQRGGSLALSLDTARSGRGRKRKLRPIQQLEGRIHDAYSTLNHQLSTAIIDFARNHGAGTIQVEDLEGLKEQLTGTFLGQRWRYHQLQQFLDYKAREAGIVLRKVPARFTSRRCSACGFIHQEFDRARRDADRQDGYVARFHCPQCHFECDPDYNAARNIATLDIAEGIAAQCRLQGIDLPAH
jgi:IS605 OrfB family transposase